jgi:hypothetical protein
MSGVNIPIEIYDLLERRLGRDDALVIAKSIETSLTHVEQRSREMAVQRKIEAKEELRVELRNELATKEDLAKLEGLLREEIAKMDTRFERMDKKFTVLFMVTIFTVIFLNQSALEFLARILGLVK